jgi:hypothetical protein
MRTLFVLALAGCAGSKPSSHPQKPAPTVTAAPVSAGEAEPDAVPEPVRAGGSRFAASPITGLAEQVIQVSQAAIRGEPLPAVDFPIERHQPDDKLVRSDEPIPRELEFVVFAMELEIALSAPKPASGAVPPGAEPPDGLECQLFLTQHGLKLISIKADSVSDPKPVPHWLPVTPLADELIADLRQDRMQRWWIGDAEKALLGPALIPEIEREHPKPAHLAAAKQLAKSSTRVHGIRIDDLALLGRDVRGQFWGMKLQFESGDVVELDAHPLVRVERLDRERR